MIDPNHPRLPVVRQCALVALSRSTYYYSGCGESSFNRQLMPASMSSFWPRRGLGPGRWSVIFGAKGTQWAASGYAA